jgi:hypothetical protein
MTDKKWFDQLTLELRLRQVPGVAIGDTVASARELLSDTGQSAEEAFGSARVYAASLDFPGELSSPWRNGTLWPSVAGLLAFLLFSQAIVAWAEREALLFSPAQLAFLAIPVLAIALLPLYLNAAMRHLWALILLVVVGGISGLLASIASPDDVASAWLVLDAAQWMIGSFTAMVLLAVGNTVRTARRGSRDDIVEPFHARSSRSVRSARWGAAFINWLFPLLGVVLFAVVALATR